MKKHWIKKHNLNRIREKEESFKKVKTKNVLGCFEINSMFRTSVHGFLPDLWHAYNMVRVIEGKIAYKTELKGNKNYFEIAGGSSYRWFELPRVKLQQMKSRGNRLWLELARGWSYRGFELSGVNCMFKK